MRYTPISSDFFKQNRKDLASQLKPNSVAIIHSNDILPTNADGTLPFKQNSDMFYLSGIDQEESVLLLYPDANTEAHREVLFVKETSELIKMWEGAKLTKEEAIEISGVETVIWVSDLERVLGSLIFDAEFIYLNSNEHLRASRGGQTRDERFQRWCFEHYPLHKYERLAPILQNLRVCKKTYEIEQLKKAIDITDRGFRRVLKFVKPGVKEYEIEAEYIHEYIRNGSRGFAYEPIIASGGNACVLHYVANDQVCNDGDLLLMDVAAEYGNYNADLTRTIPVNGKFTDRQKAVYMAVYRVQQGAMRLLEPGNDFKSYNKEIGRMMESELIGLGLLDKTDVANQDPEKPLYRKYFMHGTSHHLGLAVHDVGSFHQSFEPGMVFTIEPGIYIPDENIGIRLENNVVIMEDRVDDLMSQIPLLPEEIEEAMN